MIATQSYPMTLHRKHKSYAWGISLAAAGAVFTTGMLIAASASSHTVGPEISNAPAYLFQTLWDVDGPAAHVSACTRWNADTGHGMSHQHWTADGVNAAGQVELESMFNSYCSRSV